MTETLQVPPNENGAPSADQSPTVVSEIEAGVSNPFEVIPSQTEAYVRLAESDKVIVNEAVHASVEGYKRHISKLEAHIAISDRAPELIQDVSRQAFQGVPDALADQLEAKRSSEGFEGFSPDIKAGISSIAELQLAAQKLSHGVSITRDELAAMGIKVPRMALPRKKQQLLSTQISQRIAAAQAKVLSEAGITDINDVQRRASGQAARAVKAEDCVDFVAGQTDELQPTTIRQFSDDVLIAAAIGRLDGDRVMSESTGIFGRRLQELFNYRMRHELGLIDPRHIYDDHTIAGQQARHEIQANGMEETYLKTYYQALIRNGYDEPSADSMIVAKRAEWTRRVEWAQEKFAVSVMPGDTVLEHYTPYLLGVLSNGGLKSKDQHGQTSINNRSQLVHFTSRGAETGSSNSLNYSLYGKVSGIVGEAMGRNPDLQPVSGVLKMSLAQAIEGGLNYAALTTKELDGRNYVDDIVLADEQGQPQDINLDQLEVVVSQLRDGYGDNPRFAYDYRIENRLDAIRKMYQESDQHVEWSDFLAEHFKPDQIARQLVVDLGIDPAWVEQHVHADAKEADAKLQAAELASKRIVPLARSYKGALRGEHVDGSQATHQAVYLGVVNVAA